MISRHDRVEEASEKELRKVVKVYEG